MKAAFLFTLTIILLSVEALSLVKNPFELMTPPLQVHTITDCMYVTSESGDFVFRKAPQARTAVQQENINLVDSTNPVGACGLYVFGDSNQIVEITMKHVDVNCEDGALLGFIDGWQLNDQYFPAKKEHEKRIDDRVTEFCNDYTKWPIVTYKKTFRSSQNAALLAYRIPVQGSFIANVNFHRINEPCNILVEDVPKLYTLSNFGHHRNCTLTAIFQTVITIINVHIGERVEADEKQVNYDCQSSDRLEIGGGSGLDTHNMEKVNQVCGHTEHRGPEQAIFCGVTSLRLVSSGKYRNNVTVLIRQADENDLGILTLACS